MPDDPRSPRLLATYRVHAEPSAIEARAHALAVEQSVEMPLEAIDAPRIVDEIAARVHAIEPLHDGAYRVTLALAAGTLGDDIGQWMNMLAGNCSLQPDVALVDVTIPDVLLATMPGPRHGIAGWRTATGVLGRPLTCTALKPQGLDAPALAALGERMARAGIDVVKDDHGIADSPHARFAQRVPLVQRAIARANAVRAAQGDASRTVYAPCLSGGPPALERQLAIVHDEGVGAVLACPMLMGLPTFVDVVRAHAGVPILAHPAFAGSSRIEPALLLGTIFRLAGCDATIFPNFGGRFSYDRAQCRAIAHAARAPLGAMAPVLPVPAGGMRVDGVDEIVDEFGREAMLLIGGDLLRAGAALETRAREFVRRVAQSGAR